MKCYLTLMLLAPALNLFAENLTHKGWLIFLAVFALIALLWGCVLPSDSAGFNNGYSPLTFVLIYMIGRYLRIDYKRDKKKCTYWELYILSVLAIFLIIILKQKWALYYCNPLLIFSASMLFVIFTKWNIGSNRFINWMSSSVFAVFIFHTHEPIVGWLEQFNTRLLQSESYLIYLAIMFLLIVAIFVVAILMDKLRAQLFRQIINLTNKFVISTKDDEQFISVKK